MDDQFLEKRLNKLKDGYENIPSTTSADRITNYVFEEEKKRCKRMRFNFSKLPYIASSIAVIFIICILGAQYVLEPNTTQLSKEGTGPSSAKEEAEQLTEEERAELEEEINAYLKEKITGIESKTLPSNLEQADYITQAVQQIESNMFTIYEQKDMLYVGNKKESKSLVADAKAYIDFQFALPAENIKQYAQTGAEWYESEDQLLTIMDKQQQLSELLIASWQEQQLSEQVSSIPSSKLIYRLNEYQSIEDAQVRKFAKMVKENGLVFVDNGEGKIGLQVDYQWMQKELYEQLTARMNDYFEIRKQLIVTSDGELIISWDDLSDLIIKLEDFMMQNPTFSKSPDLHQYYYQFLTYYLFGLDNSPVFDNNGVLLPEVKESYERFMKTYDNQQTYYTVKGYYDLLEKHQFRRSEESASYVISGLTQRVPVSQKTNTSSSKLLPLASDLSKIYEQFAKLKDEQILEGLSPLDMMRLYVHADEINDEDTKYELYIQDESYYLPSKEKYMEEVKQVSAPAWQDINEQIASIETEKIDKQTEVIKMNMVNEEESKFFRLIKNQKGIWKVSWLPMQ